MNKTTSKTILIVDDEPSLPEAISYLLQVEGYTTLMAGSGNAAFGMIEKQPCDLVLSDVRMNDGDGIQLLEQIRKRRYDEPAVILITGFSDITLADAQDLGANSLIHKPFNLDNLLDVIKQALTARGDRWRSNPIGGLPQLDCEFKAPNLESAIASGMLNLGTGGFFINQSVIKNVQPSSSLLAGKRIAFSLNFTGKNAEGPLDGEASISWTRLGLQAEMSLGLGLEIESVLPSSFERIDFWIKANRPLSYIPKK